jgi:hypothetical protein
VFEKQRVVLIFGEAGMVQRFPFVLRTGKKILEIAGAGCASAVVAFILGSPHEQPSSAATNTNTPAVVRLAPADEEMIRAVRHDSAALVAHLRGGAQQTPAATTAATSATSSGGAVVSTSTSSKPAKTAPPQTRREAKVSRPPVAETKPHTPEPSPVPVAAAPAPVPQAARPQASVTVETTEPRVAQASVPADSGQLLGIKPISTWFSDVPRPPVGIAESPARAM